MAKKNGAPYGAPFSLLPAITGRSREGNLPARRSLAAMILVKQRTEGASLKKLGIGAVQRNECRLVVLEVPFV